MKWIYWIAGCLLTFFISCEKNDVNPDYSNVKIKRIAPVLDGVDTDTLPNFGINFEYNMDNKICRVNEWILEYNNDELTTLSKHTIDTFLIGFDTFLNGFIDNPEKIIFEHLEKYSFHWNTNICQRTLYTLYKKSGENISITTGLTRYYFYGVNNMIDSVVINDNLDLFSNTHDCYGYSYSNNNITEIRGYKNSYQGFLLVERLKYSYTNSINPFYFIYQNTKTQLPIFWGNHISKNLPKEGEFISYKIDGTEQMRLKTEYKYTFNSQGLPVLIEYNSNKTEIEYY